MAAAVLAKSVEIGVFWRGGSFWAQIFSQMGTSPLASNPFMGR